MARTKPLHWTLAVLLVVAAIAVGVHLAWRADPATTLPEHRPEAAAAEREAEAEPPVRYPVASAAVDAVPQPAPELPGLADSDAPALGALAELFDLDDPAQLFVSEHLVPRLVASIDALPRRRLPSRLLPVRPPAGAFRTVEVDGERYIAPDNAGRYHAYLGLLERADPDALVRAYVSAYPLFQRAYVELGHPGGYFNDRLVEVIDHLLAVPRPAGPIAVDAADDHYVFTDPALEAASVGHRLLLRLPPGQRDAAVERLRTLRGRLVEGTPPSD